MSNQKPTTRSGRFTTIQIKSEQTSKVDLVAERMGVRRAQVIGWAVEYFDLDDFLAKSLLDSTVSFEKQLTVEPVAA